MTERLAPGLCCQNLQKNERSAELAISQEKGGDSREREEERGRGRGEREGIEGVTRSNSSIPT